MPITLPSIEVIFKQLAITLIGRSARGIAILIVRDETDKTFNFKEYKNITAVEADSAKFKTENLTYIKDIFNYALNKVVVVRIDATIDTIAEALAIVGANYPTGWITIADGAAQDFTDLVTWIKSKEATRKTYKAVVYKVAAEPDCKHIVNFFNDNVTFADLRGFVTGEEYCPSLIGILASCNVFRGTTFYDCSNLIHTTEVADNEAAVGAGKLILINDVDTVRIALGVNSLTTTNGTTATEDMKFVDIVEAMDLINDDITKVFHDEYLGKFKNNYDNQILFISAINTYFEQLKGDSILDEGYNNKAGVDVETQRAAWVAIGNIAAADWTDQGVKNNAYKRAVFLAGDIKVLGAMENLKFSIALV